MAANRVNTEILKDALRYPDRFGSQDAFPDIYTEPFILKNLKDVFKITYAQVAVSDKINFNKLKEKQSQLMRKCIEIEKPFRNQLERICVDCAVELFNIPPDSVDISSLLVDEVNLNDPSIIVEPESNSDLSVEVAAYINDEVGKRRLINILSTGAATYYSEDVGLYSDAISTLSDELLDLYRQISLINRYLLFKENIEIDDHNKMQGGTAILRFGTQDSNPKIEAQGSIFPILLFETIRGCMDLFVSHGLPKSGRIAKTVLSMADYLQAEPWNMRLGPALWNLLIDSTDDMDSMYIPYLMKRISSLNVKKFNYLMNEVFAKTPKGKEIMVFLCKKSVKDAEKLSYAGKQNVKSNGFGIIKDTL